MRHTCELKGPDDEPCGEPAVDFILIHFKEKKWWLCAQHWDRWIRLCQILNLKDYDRVDSSRTLDDPTTI